ncbi:MAG: helix-turn-helix domain-containing protein [Bacteriovoracaceae bacterium]|jgi:transcriptional regulator with XRE-family HTH domain|nr:helix-turn-helix domain-containing protein [Bacteriovoracaceae bacterium]
MNEIKIGSVIKHYLENRRLSLRELAAKAQIPYSTLHSWQENRTPKDIEKVKRLANTIGINVDELIFGISKKQAEKDIDINDEVFKGTFEVTIKIIK